MPPAVSEEKIQEWKNTYGEVYEIKDDELEEKNPLPVMYFKKPGRTDLSKLAKEMMKDSYKAVNNLVFGCLLHPAPEVVKKAFDVEPGLAIKVAAKLQEIIGLDRDFSVNKL